MKLAAFVIFSAVLSLSWVDSNNAQSTAPQSRSTTVSPAVRLQPIHEKTENPLLDGITSYQVSIEPVDSRPGSYRLNLTISNDISDVVVSPVWSTKDTSNFENDPSIGSETERDFASSTAATANLQGKKEPHLSLGSSVITPLQSPRYETGEVAPLTSVRNPRIVSTGGRGKETHEAAGFLKNPFFVERLPSMDAELSSSIDDDRGVIPVAIPTNFIEVTVSPQPNPSIGWLAAEHPIQRVYADPMLVSPLPSPAVSWEEAPSVQSPIAPSPVTMKFTDY